MPDLQGTSNPQRKEQAGAADWGFVAFVIIITAIAVGRTLFHLIAVLASTFVAAPHAAVSSH
jgi:hypothetical protein